MLYVVLTPQLAAGQKLCCSHMWVARFFLFFVLQFFKSVKQLASLPIRRITLWHLKKQLMSSLLSLLHSISALLFSLSARSFSFLCLLACSYSLINSLIKDATSKPQLQGLCLPVFVRDGNWRKEQARAPLSPPPPLLLFASTVLSTLARTLPSVSLVGVLVSEQSQQLFNAQGELCRYPAWILITSMLTSKISLTRLCPGYLAQGRHGGTTQGMWAVSLSLAVVSEGRLALEGVNEIGRVEHLQSPANEACLRRRCTRMERGHFYCKSTVLRLIGIR